MKTWLTLAWSFIALAYASCQSWQCHLNENFNVVPSTQIYSLSRFANQSLYFISNEGLIRFDGKNMDIFSLEAQDNASMSALLVTQDTIWVGLDNGELHYFLNEKFQRWELEEGTIKRKITGIYKDANLSKWITTYGEGVYHHDGRHLYHFGQEDGLNDLFILSAVLDKNQQLFVGTDHGVNVCSYVQGNKKVIPLSKNTDLEKESITTLHISEKNKTLYCVSSEKNLWSIQYKYPNATPQKIDHNILDTYTIFDDEIISIDKEKSPNIHVYNLQTGQAHVRKIRGLNQIVKVKNIYLDLDKNIWFYCKNNGLCLIEKSYTYYDSPIKNPQALLIIEEDIYIGHEDGLEVKSNGKWKRIINHNVLSLHYDQSNKTIWIGTYGHGLICLNTHGKTIHSYTEKTGLNNNNVFSIEAFNGDIWICTLAGLQKINSDGKISTTYSKSNGLNTDYNYILFADSKKRLWVGSHGHGLSFIDDKNDLFHLNSKKTIIDITEDHKGNIWFLTQDKSIGYFNGTESKEYLLQHGITSNLILNIDRTKQGKITVFHTKGYEVIDPATMVQYSYHNDLSLNTGMHTNIVYVQNNDFFIAGNQSIAQFSTIQSPPKAPSLYIKFATCGTFPISSNTHNTLHHNDNNFILEYEGILFPRTNGLHYKYKMHPIDKTWRYTADSKIIYPGLNSAKYTFEIVPGVGGHFYEDEAYKVAFAIQKPIWKHWWFLIIISLASILLFYYYIYQKNKRQKVLLQLQNDSVKNQLEILKSQINPHFLFNSFNHLISIIETSPKDAVIVVEKMADFYRNILEYRDKDLIPLKEELLLLDSYVFLLKQRFEDDLKIDINVDSLDAEVIPLSLQLLVENAIKHNAVSRSKPLFISIYEENGYLVVKNNLSPRSTVESSTHFGLKSLSKRYLATHDKEIIIEKNEFFYIVKIPFKNE